MGAPPSSDLGRLALRVCRGPRCGRTSRPLYDAARRYVRERGLEALVEVLTECCFAHCPLGPNVLVERRIGGGRDERAVAAAMAGAPDQSARGACLVHRTRAEDIAPIIDYYVSLWGGVGEER